METATILNTEYPVLDTELPTFSITPNGYVGGYRLGKKQSKYIQFNLSYKPKWLHRQFMRIFLGWYWFDN